MVPNPNLIKNPANSTLPSKRKMSPIGPGKSAKKVNSVGSIPLYNRYMPLSDNDKSTTDQNKATTPDTAKPAVLYIRNVPMSTVVALITTAIKHKNFKCTNLRRGAFIDVKLQCDTIDDYRTSINALDSSDIKYYTYRMKTLRGISVVIKGIEVSNNPIEMCEDIKMDLEKKGFMVRQVINILNREKIAQPLYKVELEPSVAKLNPGEVHPIYSLDLLINRRISIEEPHKRFGPVQCTNCQEFDHTKGYCNLQAKCVVCGEDHSTEFCTKPKDDPSCRRCANCNEGHTANYRGCRIYKALLKAMKNTSSRQNPSPPSRTTPPAPLIPSVPVTQHISYRNALTPPPPPNPNPTNQNNGPPQTTEQMLQMMMSSMMQFMTTFQSSMQEMMRNQTQLIELLQCRR